MWNSSKGFLIIYVDFINAKGIIYQGVTSVHISIYPVAMSFATVINSSHYYASF